MCINSCIDQFTCESQIKDRLTSLTSGEGLREHLGGERGLGARARGGAVLVLQVRVLLAEHVPPAAVQEAVQDVRRDDVRQRQRLLRLEARLQAQRGAGQHGAHGAGSRAQEDRRATRPSEEPKFLGTKAALLPGKLWRENCARAHQGGGRGE